MKNKFKEYLKLSDILDSAVKNLPTLEEYLKISELKIPADAWEGEQKDEKPVDRFRTFLTHLNQILECFEIKNIKFYEWHQHMLCIQFSPPESPYFKLGEFGMSCDVPVDGNLKAVIGIGFDEDLDYFKGEYDRKPALIIYYIYGANGNCTDLNLFSSTEWRDVLNEFFDITALKSKYS